MSDAKDFDYEDVTVYTLDDDTEDALIEQNNECTFMWANSSCEPVGVIMSYLRRDGKFWLTAAQHRLRVPAVRKNPAVAICITSRGTEMDGLRGGRTVTYKGTCRVIDDAETKAWFYPALAHRLYGTRPEMEGPFAKFLDSPNRIILEVTPTKRIGYDGAKMGKATREAMEAGGKFATS